MCFDISRCMNGPNAKGGHYIPTDIEHIANTLTHAVFIPISLIAFAAMNSNATTPMHHLVSIVYGSGLFLLALISSAFHLLCYLKVSRKWIKTFHLLDRFIIYIFIASAYTPWLLLQDFETIGMEFVCFVWAMAVTGVMYSIICYEKYQILDTVFYVAVGLIPALPLVREMQKGHWELIGGGFFYIFGIKFFRSDGKVPFAHAIWHLFVAAATTIHFIGVWTHLF